MRFLVLFLLLCLISSVSLAADFGKPRIITPGVQYISDPEKPLKWVTYEFQKKYGVQKLFDVKPFYPMVPVTAERLLSRPKIDLLVKGLAKRIGPLALASTIIDLVWNAEKGVWEKPEEIPSGYPQGCWYAGSYAANGCSGDPLSACQKAHADIVSIRSAGTNRFECVKANNTSPGATVMKFQCSSGQVLKNGICVQPSMVPASDSDLEAEVSGAIDQRGVTPFLQPLKENNALDPSDADPISSVDGPTGAQKPKVEVKTKTDETGTTTITTTTTPYISYQGDTIIIEIHVHRRYVFPDGTSKDEDEWDKPDPDEDPPPDLCQKYPNSAMCKPPVDLCEKYPNIALCQPPKEGEQEDFCEEHPEASACKPLDAVPDIDLPTDEKNFDINPEMSASGECPAPIQVVILGSMYSITWEPVCYVARGIRPFVIISAWLGAGIFLFMIGAVSRGR